MKPLCQLWNGFDTCKANFGVAWPHDFADLLAELEKHKQLAFESDQPQVFELAPAKPFDKVVVLPKGSSHARHAIQVEGMTIFFACRQLPHQETPNLYVEAGPEYVAENGLPALFCFVLDMIHQMGGQYLWNKVQEIHMTVDTEVDEPHTEADYRTDGQFNFVTRARTLHPHYGQSDEPEEIKQALWYKGRHLNTMAFGYGQTMLRIYDKKAELKVRPRKQWEQMLWEDPEAEHVIRTEFQLRREALKELGYDKLEDVMDRSPELWAYLTHKWFRLYGTHSDEHRQMKILHPFWMAVQDAWAEREPAVKKKTYHAVLLQRLQQILGQATSLAAVVGTKKVLTVDDLLAMVKQMSQEMLPEKDITGIIRDKAIRFQCRNKADVGSTSLPEVQP